MTAILPISHTAQAAPSLPSSSPSNQEEIIPLSVEERTRWEATKNRHTKLQPNPEWEGFKAKEGGVKAVFDIRDFPSLTLQGNDLHELIKKIQTELAATKVVIQGGAVEEVLTGKRAADVDISFYLPQVDLDKIVDSIRDKTFSEKSNDDFLPNLNKPLTTISKYLHKKLEKANPELAEKVNAFDLCAIYLSNKYKIKKEGTYLSFIRFGTGFDFKFIVQQSTPTDIRASSLQVDWFEPKLSCCAKGELQNSIQDLKEKRLAFLPFPATEKRFNMLWRAIHYFTKGYKIDELEYAKTIQEAVELFLEEKPHDDKLTSPRLINYLESHYISREEGGMRAFFFMWNLTEVLIDKPEYKSLLHIGFKKVFDSSSLTKEFQTLLGQLQDTKTSFEEIAPLVRAFLEYTHLQQNPANQNFTGEGHRSVSFSRAHWHVSGSALQHYQGLIDLLPNYSTSIEKRSLVSALFLPATANEQSLTPSLLGYLLETISPAKLNEKPVHDFLKHLAIDLKLETLQGFGLRDLFEKSLAYRLDSDYQIIAEDYIGARHYSFSKGFCDKLVKYLTVHHGKAIAWVGKNQWWQMKLHLEKLNNEPKATESLILLPDLYNAQSKDLESDIVDKLTHANDCWPRDNIRFTKGIYNLIMTGEKETQDRLLSLFLQNLILPHNKIGEQDILTSSELAKLTILSSAVEARAANKDKEGVIQILQETRLSVNLLLFKMQLKTEDRKNRLLDEVMPLALLLLEKNPSKETLENIEDVFFENVSLLKPSAQKGRGRRPPAKVDPRESNLVVQFISVWTEKRKSEALPFLLKVIEHPFLKELKYSGEFYIQSILYNRDASIKEITPLIECFFTKTKRPQHKDLFLYLFEKRALLKEVLSQETISYLGQYLIAQAKDDDEKAQLVTEFQPGQAQENNKLALLQNSLQEPKKNLESLITNYPLYNSNKYLDLYKPHLETLVNLLLVDDQCSEETVCAFLKAVFQNETCPKFLNKVCAVCCQLVENKKWDMYPVIKNHLKSKDILFIDLIIVLHKYSLFSKERVEQCHVYLLKNLDQCPNLPALLEIYLKKNELANIEKILEIFNSKKIEIADKEHLASLFITSLKILLKRNYSASLKVVETSLKVSLLNHDQAFELLTSCPIPNDSFDEFKNCVNCHPPSKLAIVSALEKPKCESNLLFFLLELLTPKEDIQAFLPKVTSIPGWSQHPALMSLLTSYIKHHPKNCPPFVSDCLNESIRNGSQAKEWGDLFVQFTAAEKELRKTMLTHCLSAPQSEEFYLSAVAFAQTLEADEKAHFLAKLYRDILRNGGEKAKAAVANTFSHLQKKQQQLLFKAHIKILCIIDPEKCTELFNSNERTQEELVSSIPLLSSLPLPFSLLDRIEKIEASNDLDSILEALITFFPKCDQAQRKVLLDFLIIKLPSIGSHNKRLQLCGLFIEPSVMSDLDISLLRKVIKHVKETCLFEEMIDERTSFGSLFNAMKDGIHNIESKVVANPELLKVEERQEALAELLDFSLKILRFINLEGENSFDFPIEKVLLFLFASNPEKYHWKLLEFRQSFFLFQLNSTFATVDKIKKYIKHTLDNRKTVKTLFSTSLNNASLYQASLFLIISNSKLNELFHSKDFDKNYTELNAMIYCDNNAVLIGNDEKNPIDIHRLAVMQLAVSRFQYINIGHRIEPIQFILPANAYTKLTAVIERITNKKNSYTFEDIKELAAFAQFETEYKEKIHKTVLDQLLKMSFQDEPDFTRYFYWINILYQISLLEKSRSTDLPATYWQETSEILKALSESTSHEHHEFIIEFLLRHYLTTDNPSLDELFLHELQHYNQHLVSHWMKDVGNVDNLVYLEIHKQARSLHVIADFIYSKYNGESFIKARLQGTPNNTRAMRESIISQLNKLNHTFRNSLKQEHQKGQP